MGPSACPPEYVRLDGISHSLVSARHRLCTCSPGLCGWRRAHQTLLPLQVFAVLCRCLSGGTETFPVPTGEFLIAQ